jgi:hypothetical protein
MQSKIPSGPKELSLVGARGDTNGHWVTLKGNHVFIRDSTGEPLDDQLPPTPRAPSVDPGAWQRNVEMARISPTLGTVHDLGVIIFNETQSYTDRPDSNEPIEVAREQLAHAVMNADDLWGADRMKNASTALPIEPSDSALENPDVRSAYESSMKAAREAFLSGSDPTNGAVFAIQVKTADRSNFKFQGKSANPDGVPISTQSGPYNNSFPNKKMPSRTAWLNTYWNK